MALNALRTALSHLGFTNAAAVFITDQQGLDSLDKFCPLTDDKVENLIKVTFCPGRTIPNPAPLFHQSQIPGYQSLYMQKTT